jgi:hypothetical protein
MGSFFMFRVIHVDPKPTNLNSHCSLQFSVYTPVLASASSCKCSGGNPGWISVAVVVVVVIVPNLCNLLSSALLVIWTPIITAEVTKLQIMCENSVLMLVTYREFVSLVISSVIIIL